MTWVHRIVLALMIAGAVASWALVFWAARGIGQ